MRSLITSYFGFIVASLLIAAPIALARHGQEAIAKITPYKATYALTFGPNGSNSPFRGGSGRLTIEITRSRCTDYRIVRSLTSTMNSDRGPLKIQSEAVFAENTASTQFAFSYNEHNNTGPARRASLVAHREAGRITVTSAVRKPSSLTISYFPCTMSRC